jgi:hypothetical protein
MSDYGMKLWQSGVRGEVPQHFYDIPLGRFKPFGDEFLTASVGRDTEGGRETYRFVFERQMLFDWINSMPLAIRDAMLDTTGTVSAYLRFDVVASLTAPKDGICPFFVEKLAPSASTRAVLMPFDGDVEDRAADGNAGTDDDEEDWDERYFPIAIDYKPFINRLAASSDLLLRRPDLEPEAISCIGRLKYALTRLPVCTDGIGFNVALSRKTDDHGSWGGLSLELRPETLALSYVGYIYGPCGGDSDCQTVYACEAGGYRSDFDDDPATVYSALEDWVSRWENQCSDPDITLEITDDCETFDWDQFEDESAWDGMPSNYA